MSQHYDFAINCVGHAEKWDSVEVEGNLNDRTPLRACKAADLKVKHRIYYADSFAAALAIEHKATLVTSDSDFRRLGHAFPVIWLKA